jgi:hypothetical protein
MIEGSGSQFTLGRFKQMLRVMPEFFIHRWETKADKVELFIDVPSNIKETLQKMKDNLPGPYVASEEPMVAALMGELLTQRKTLFRKQLLTLTYKAYIAYQTASGFTEFKMFTEWPREFDIESLPSIPEANLKPMPKAQKTENLSSYLEKFDIREAVLDSRQIDFQTPLSRPDSNAPTPRRRQSDDKLLMMADDIDDSRSESILSLS